jgi:hypothetical protein
VAKVTISRIYELSRYIATKSGKELQGPLEYLAEFAELTLRSLRNGLTFSDNMDCESRRVTVRNDTETVISIATNKRAQRIYLDRVIDQTYYVVTSFGWKYNSKGEIVVKVGFDGSPSSSQDLTIDLCIHFG